jgi:shikimate kinase
MNVYLVGFMGSGKSHTGQQLATALNLPFVDLDDRLETQEGRSIGQIFETDGEAHFRQLEAKILRDTINDHSAIISCGGGAPCFHQNMDWINAHGLSIYLQASVELLAKRLKKGQAQRPLVRDLNETQLEAFIAERLSVRESFYHQAKLIVSQIENESLVPQLVALYQTFLSAPSK